MPFAVPGQTILTIGGRRLPVSVGGLVSRVYSEFVTHITGLATGGDLAWTGVQPVAGAFTTTAGVFNSGDTFTGTSWNDWFRRNAANGNAAMIVRHGAPSQAEADNQSTRGRKIFLQISAGTAPTYNALLRNGYQSTAGTTGLTSAGKLDRMLLWIGDDTTGSAIEMLPSTAGGPTPYVW